jgi:hypothetical protein
MEEKILVNTSLKCGWEEGYIGNTLCNSNNTALSYETLSSGFASSTNFVPFDMITSELLAETFSCMNSPSDCTLEDIYSPGFYNICFDFDNPKANMQFDAYSPVLDDNDVELVWSYALETTGLVDANGDPLYVDNYKPENNQIVLMEADNTLSFNDLSLLQ